MFICLDFWKDTDMTLEHGLVLSQVFIFIIFNFIETVNCTVYHSLFIYVDRQTQTDRDTDRHRLTDRLHSCAFDSMFIHQMFFFIMLCCTVFDV